MDNFKSDDEGLRELALFAGAGGGILGGKLLGWRTVCAVERDCYAASVLAQRQNDGHLEPFPIWSDVTTFDGRDWRGRVDVVSGGFPCQDISIAGTGKGIAGPRSGLWGEFARIISEVRPRYAFLENSPAITFRGLGRIVGDLAELGYGGKWGVLGADICGADHHRARWWMVADSNMRGFKECRGQTKPVRLEQTCTGNYRKEVERPLLGMDDGLANWVDRHHAIGNGQVPAVARVAWEILTTNKEK
jgi:DNA (cytosine-5)-methyltransferase 1